MTRKNYRGKVRALVLAIYAGTPGEKRDGWKIGESVRYANDNVHKAIKAHGSYRAAWDSLKEIRRLYGL